MILRARSRRSQCHRSPVIATSTTSICSVSALMVKPFMLAGKAAASDAVWHLKRNGKASKAVTEGGHAGRAADCVLCDQCTRSGNA